MYGQCRCRPHRCMTGAAAWQLHVFSAAVSCHVSLIPVAFYKRSCSLIPVGGNSWSEHIWGLGMFWDIFVRAGRSGSRYRRSPGLTSCFWFVFVIPVSSFLRPVFSFLSGTTSRTCATWTPWSPGNGVGPRLMRLGSCGLRSCRSFAVRYNVENSVANDGRRRVFRTESMCTVWSLVCFCQACGILDLNDADIFVFLPLHLEHDKARRSKGSCSVGALCPCDRMRTLVFVCVCDIEQ